MSNFRNLVDYFWPPARPLHDSQPEVSSPESLDDDSDMSTHEYQLQHVKQRGQRHDRTRRDDGAESSRPHLAINAGGYRRSPTTPIRNSSGENIELQPVTRQRRRHGEDDCPAKGLQQRVRDLEASNVEHRKLADDRQLRIRALEKENIGVKSQVDATLRRLQALQAANNSFIVTISELERELHTIKVQHAPCSNRISTADTRYSSLLSAHTVLQSAYNDLRSSHNVLQSSCTSLQMSHSALVFANSVSFTPKFAPRPVHSESLLPLPHPQPPSPTLHASPPPISRESSTQTSSTPSSTTPSTPGSDVSRLKTLLNDRTSELNSLQMFLSKHDECSGAQIVQAVKDLNGEISRLAAAVSEHFSIIVSSSGASSSSALDTVNSDSEIHSQLCEVLGSKFYNLIGARFGSSSDPTLMIQYALQAWEIWCCTQILDKFCFGLPEEVEKWLSNIWENMKDKELQPMSSRWRGLAHEYLRVSLQAEAPNTTQLPTPPASPFLSAKNNPRSLLSKQEQVLSELNIRGVRGILSLAGSGSSSAMKIEEEYGDSIRRIHEQAINLAQVVREAVMSGWFEFDRVPGTTTILPPTGPSLLSPAGVVGPNRGKTNRKGKGKGNVSSSVPIGFDDQSMENVFKGYGREEGGVMCTVELGLVCVRKEDKEHSNTFADAEGLVPRTGDVGTMQGLDRRMLIKPKVLLESADEFL